MLSRSINNHPRINQHPQCKKLLAMLLRINMGGNPLFKNTILEDPNFWIIKPMENPWKTNGFKAFLILNLMNRIFGSAVKYLGEYLLMDLDLLGRVIRTNLALNGTRLPFKKSLSWELRPPVDGHGSFSMFQSFFFKYFVSSGNCSYETSNHSYPTSKNANDRASSHIP